MNNDPKLCELQKQALNMLLRNKNLLDALSKMQESAAKTSRKVIRASTHCGCIALSGEMQDINVDMSAQELKSQLSYFVDGELCEECKFAVEKEIGSILFYLSIICNALGLDMQKIFEDEIERNKIWKGYTLK